MKKSDEEPFDIRLARRDAGGEPDGIVRSLPAAYTDRSLPGFSLSRSPTRDVSPLPPVVRLARRGRRRRTESRGGRRVVEKCGGPSARRRVGGDPFGEAQR